MCPGFRELSSDWVKRQRNDVILTVTKAKKEWVSECAGEWVACVAGGIVSVRD